MNAVKKFLTVLLLFVSFETVAHAEEVDAYFTWEIEKCDDYNQYNSVLIF